MPDVTTLLIAGGAWMALLAFACAMCTAAARGDDAIGTPAQDRGDARAVGRTVVADTGGIRARLRAADGMLEAEQLTVTVDVDGTDAVLATSRPVLIAEPGDWVQLAVPVRLGGRTVATLRALRRPGSEPFDMTDRLMLQTIAARVSTAIDAARTAPARDRPTALA